ncbi:hypothetical protein SPLC1_S208500 [Arthrospira platensis C1]|nr:hypothetical protein SPLC1_S208500 [Arthrospira platensis C1]
MDSPKLKKLDEETYHVVFPSPDGELVGLDSGKGFS